MAITDFLVNTDYSNDQVIFVTSGSVVVPARVSGTPGSNDVTVPHGLAFEILPMFQWSFFSDFSEVFGAYNADYLSYSGFPNSGVSAGVSSYGGNLIFSPSNFYTSSKTIYYRMWGFLPHDADVETEVPTVSTGYDFIYSTDFNYLKFIGSTKMTRTSISDSGNKTFSHNLGYKPLVYGWQRISSNGQISSPDALFASISKITSSPSVSGIYVTDTQIIWLGTGEGGNFPWVGDLELRYYAEEGTP